MFAALKRLHWQKIARRVGRDRVKKKQVNNNENNNSYNNKYKYSNTPTEFEAHFLFE